MAQELQTNKIVYGDKLKSQAGKYVQPTSSPKTEEQVQFSDRKPRGSYGPNFPYPAENVGGANIEFAKNIRRQTTFGQLALHTVKQGGLYLTNPTNANVVNPAEVTGQLPSEGMIPTTFDAIIRDPIAIKAKTINDPRFGALIRANVGQIEGPIFAPQNPLSVNQAIDKVADAVMGALGIKNNAGNAVQSPKSNNLTGRLQESNRLDPSTVDDNQTRFYQLYKVGVGSRSWRADAEPSELWSKKIGDVDKTDIAKFSAPINGGSSVDLSGDFALSQNLEEGWKTNLAYSNPLTDGTDSAVAAKEPIVLDTTNGTMTFPFYFESLNTFAETPERFITFQATFSNLREEYKPVWNSKKYFGRPQPIYIYESTERTISFDFIIHTPDRSLLGVMKQRINWLARHVYPSFINFGDTQKSNQNNTANQSQNHRNYRIVFESPIIKFTIGDLFRNVPGIIKGLTYDWDMGGNNRWEISKDIIMPQMVKVTMTIDVLHDKFMQNSAISTVSSDGQESSDFYQFIKPQERKLIPYLTSNKTTIDEFTPTEVDNAASETVYGTKSQ